MAVTLERTKGRKSTARFYQLQDAVITHPNWFKLRDGSQRLFVDLLSQYNGSNNGDLCGAMSLMSKRGWISNSKLTSATKELRYYEFVVTSRQGGRNRATLYALTCFPIDDCGGKLDIGSTKVAPQNYKTTKKHFREQKRQQ